MVPRSLYLCEGANFSARYLVVCIRAKVLIVQHGFSQFVSV